MDHETIGIWLNFFGIDIVVPKTRSSSKCWRQYSEHSLQLVLRNKINTVTESTLLHEAAFNLDEAFRSSVQQILWTRKTKNSAQEKARDSQNKPWYNVSLSAIRNRRDQCFRIAKHTDSSANWNMYRKWRNAYVKQLQMTEVFKMK